MSYLRQISSWFPYLKLCWAEKLTYAAQRQVQECQQALKRSHLSRNRFWSSSMTTQLKMLAKKLGPRWTRGELELFYHTYRKHPGDWKKVATAVRNNRSVDMVKALFHLHQAYLSLPEGTASVVGFIAMMTDHYSSMEGSESEGEGRDAFGVPRKRQKCRRAIFRHRAFREEVISSQSVASAEGCLSFLRQTQGYGLERRACGKRTPRVTEGSTPPNNRVEKQWDEGDADVVALPLAYGSRMGGGSPLRGTEFSDRTPIRLGKMSQSKEDQSKRRDSTMFENGLRISRDQRYKKGASERDDALLMTIEGVSTVENTESCNANEELRTKLPKGMVYVEASRDELEVLQALAELSASLPRAGLMESEPSAQLKEDRKPNNVNEESNTPETISSNLHREEAKQAGLVHAVSATDNGKQTSLEVSVDDNAVSIGVYGNSRKKRKLKVLDVETLKDSVQEKSLYSKEVAKDVNLQSLVKARRVGQSPPKQLKIAKTSEKSSNSDKKRAGHDALVSATQVSSPGPASLPQKPPNRRKVSLKKSLQESSQSSETNHDRSHSDRIFSDHELLKEKVLNCLSNALVRRRCIYEWFYSAIDYPWFAKTELTDYVNHARLGRIQRLTRPEWSIIKSSLGRPKRFSERFIQKERDELEQYRESVRKHYIELRAGARERHPTEFSQPLSVGDRVIAIHPKTRDIHDGKILSVDHNKCKVLFDELGDEIVMDIDCMPISPLEYMAESPRRQTDKCLSVNNEAQFNRHPELDAPALLAPSVLDNVSFSMNPHVKEDDVNGSIMHGQVLATNTTDQYITTNSKARGTETERDLMQLHTSDALEMEPEMTEIFICSNSKAEAMVDAAMKTVPSMKKDLDVGHQPLHNYKEHDGIKHINGSLGHHHSFIAQNGSGKSETQMTSELIMACVATWLIIKMCTEKKYPPGEVVQLMEKAVSRMQPRCPQNMAIYREIQTCMGWIKTGIIALVRT